MIGLIGLYHSDRTAAVSAAPMLARLPERYAREATGERGAVMARVFHATSCADGRAQSPDGRFQCVSSGVIHNRESFSDLGRAAASCAAIVAALAERGELDRLRDANGQFAAACYDTRDHRLVLVTDRLCTTPLHVSESSGTLVFGTHTYLMLGHNGIAPKADADGLFQIFSLQRTVGRSTPIAGIVSLPAATILERSGTASRERQYWHLAWRKPDFAERDGGELLAGALRRAVRRHAYGRRSGLLLSGGLDSRLVLGAAERGSLSCWTVASYAENPELAVARELAAALGAPHSALIVPPARMRNLIDRTTIESDGFYPASTQLSQFVSEVGTACDVVMTGHGLDYTLRSMYMPARYVTIAGSRTRVPLLRKLPPNPAGEDVLGMLTQRMPAQTLERVVRPAKLAGLRQRLAELMDRDLRPWLESEHPHNAWDAFIVKAVSKHYTYTGMMSVRAAVDHAMPGLDNEVMDLYLRMPPAWRISTRIVRDGLRRLSPEAARIRNANTQFRADIPLWAELSRQMTRGALRRLGIVKRKALPGSAHTTGSWHNLDALYREEPGHRRLFEDIRGRLDALTLGVLDSDGLRTCIDEHLDGRANHGKLLRLLVTHDAWVRQYGIAGSA